MNRLASWATHALAFAAGLAVAWAVNAALAGVVLSGGRLAPFIGTLVVPAFAGLAGYAGVWMILAGRLLKGRFWVGAFALVVLIWGAALYGMLAGYVTFQEGAGAALVLLFVAGGIPMTRR
ncbi:hypothetical protein [Tropicimonas sp. IMCC34011]|uniref:hypothetical protein n=1 Tax=Tropicimonas sp. IMCC34011 TaxID=2248759 RepID=UPI000E25DF93|nr:hypothetical protein [Tropicimonas sp. IMCC34011]